MTNKVEILLQQRSDLELEVEILKEALNEPDGKFYVAGPLGAIKHDAWNVKLRAMVAARYQEAMGELAHVKDTLNRLDNYLETHP